MIVVVLVLFVRRLTTKSKVSAVIVAVMNFFDHVIEVISFTFLLQLTGQLDGEKASTPDVFVGLEKVAADVD